MTEAYRILTAIVAALFLFVLAAPNVLARAELSEEINGNHVRVIDKADLLSDSEEQKLFDEIRDLSQYGHIIFYSETSVSGSTSEYIKYWYN
ncbi:MAG: hypothetical protein IK001_01815, partial [Lachnospiraceae bacterium]|nr:hypothetical protein [Lachnospiraceae bacterium]